METLILQNGIFPNVGTQSMGSNTPSDSCSSSPDGCSTPGTSYGGSLANQLSYVTNLIPSNYGSNYNSHLQFPVNIPDMTYYSDALEVLKSNSNYVCDSKMNKLDSNLPCTQQTSNQTNPSKCDNGPYADQPFSIPQQEMYDLNAQELWSLEDNKQTHDATLDNQKKMEKLNIVDEMILKNLEDPTNAVIQAIALGQNLENPGTTELDDVLDSLDVCDESTLEEVLKSYGDMESETNVGRIVDKQLNSSNEITYDVAHCEKVHLDARLVANILELDELNLHPVDFNIPSQNVIEENHNVNKLNDDLIVPNDKTIEIKENVNVKVNDVNSIVKTRHNKSKYQKVYRTSCSDSGSEHEDLADEDYLPPDLKNRTIVENPSSKRPSRKNTRTKLCKRKELLRGTFVEERSSDRPKDPPKIQRAIVPAGRKKIDMNSQKYIFDEEIDIVTVAKDEEPIIEAGDVDSLLEQFEKSEYKKSDNLKKNDLNNKRSGTNLKSKKNKSKGVGSVNEKTSASMVKQTLRKINKSRSLEEKSDTELKTRNKVSSKQEILKSHIRDDKKQKKKQASSYVPKQETQLKTPSTDKQSKEKVSDRSTKSEHGKTGAKCSSTDKKVDISKELIGRIKEGNKQRTIVLLDDPFFLGGDPFYNKKKAIKKTNKTDAKKPVTASTDSKKSGLPASSTKSSISTLNASVKNNLSQGQIMKKSDIASSSSPMQGRSLNKLLGVCNPYSVPSSRPISSCVPLKSENSSGGARKPIHNDSVPIHKSFKTYVPTQGTALVSHSILRNNQPRVVNNTLQKQVNVHTQGTTSVSHSILRNNQPRVVDNTLQKQVNESETLLNVTLDHSYSMAFPEKTDEKQKLTDKAQKQTNQPQKQTYLALRPSVDVSKSTNSKISPASISNKESKIKEFKTTSKKSGTSTAVEYNKENSKSGTVPKKVLNLEEYKKLRGIHSPKNSLDNKNMEPEDWAKKLELTTRVSVPDHLDCIETHEVSVDACLADEDALDRLDKLKPVMDEAKSILTENSFLNNYKNEVENKPVDILSQEKVHRSCVVIKYLPKDRVKPTTCTKETQTNISLVQRKKHPRSRSSSYSSYSSSDSEYSEYSTSSSRRSRSTRRSRYPSSRYYRSRSRSYSPSYRSNDEGYAEFKEDAVNRRILFLGELPSNIDKNRLYDTFGTYGKIKSIKIRYKKRSSKRMKSNSGQISQIYAFVTFYSSSSAFEAMNCYKKDYPEAEKYHIFFGGRREFCNESYEDLDKMPSSYTCEKTRNNEGGDFDKLLKEYASKRGVKINLTKDTSK